MVHHNIKKIRTDKGLSQQQVADNLHLGLRAYQKIESGETHIDIDRLQDLATIFKVDVMELINSGDNITIEKIDTNVGGISNKDVTINYHQSLEEIKSLYENQLKMKDEVIAAKDEIITNLKRQIV